MRLIRSATIVLTSILMLAVLAPAVIAADAVAVSEPSFDFGTHKVGTTSSAHSFTITNNTGAALTSTDMAVVDSADFSYTVDTCGDSLAVGATCAFSVVFHPMTVGSLTATSIHYYGPAGNVEVSLRGTGSAAKPTRSSTPDTAISLFGGGSLPTGLLLMFSGLLMLSGLGLYRIRVRAQGR